MYFKARSQKRLLLLAFCIFVFIVGYFYFDSRSQRSQDLSSPYDPNLQFTKPSYRPGIPKAPEEIYSRTLVIATTKDEDARWAFSKIPQSMDSLTVATYTVDDPDAEFVVPVNKGHESMAYLTYIIDYYDNLDNVTLFMHSHQFAWHNNDLLNADAANTVWRLNVDKVIRDGYMNLRCHLQPGCGPSKLHPSKPSWDAGFPEEPILQAAWAELFGPLVDVPDVLAQPCCGQFAVSRDRLRAIPKDQYLHFREWLTETQYADNISGRVFEHIWQFLFTGEPEFCPMESICYCEGFRLCFGGEKQYQDYVRKKEELVKLQEIAENAEQDEASHRKVDPSYQGGDMTFAKNKLIKKVQKMKAELDEVYTQALKRGDNPVQRAAEVDRTKRG